MVQKSKKGERGLEGIQLGWKIKTSCPPCIKIRVILRGREGDENFVID